MLYKTYYVVRIKILVENYGSYALDMIKTNIIAVA
jgi:hypothetical protein